jgi:riboflavin biosynthesis pyrimidine reductase
MDLPKLILHTTVSIDGRIALNPNITLSNLNAVNLDGYPRFKNLFGDWKKFASIIEEIYHPDAFLEGSNMIMYEGQPVDSLPPFKGDSSVLYTDYLPTAIVNRPEREKWLVMVDGKGRIRGGYKGDEDGGKSHILHLVSFKLPPEYLAFLKDHQIPYIITGKDRVDLREAFSKMSSLLGVKTILTSSGGKLAGALIRENLIDEINLLLNPVVVGGFKTPVLFTSPELSPPEVLPSKLRLISSHVNEDESIWLRYSVIKNK